MSSKPASKIGQSLAFNVNHSFHCFSFNYVYEMEGVHLGDQAKYFCIPQKASARCVYKNNDFKIKYGGISLDASLTGLPFSAILISVIE